MKIRKDKRRAILDAALNLISQKGFHGTSMSMLAKKAGVSVGIIYHYYDSKDSIVDQLYLDIYKNIAKVILDGNNSSLSLEKQIRQIWVLSIKYHLQNPQVCSFLQQYKNSPYFRPEIDKETDSYFSLIYQLGDQAIKEKILKDLPQQVFMTIILDFAGTLSQKHEKGCLQLTDDLINKIQDLSWDAIKY